MRLNNILQGEKPAGASLRCQPNSLRRILVVEDDRDLRQINAMVLHHAGYHVDTVEDSASAWQAFSASRYDVLITDNARPGLRDLELIEKLRSQAMPLSVVLVLGTVPAEKLERYPWLQLDAVLRKPYSPEGMLETVNAVLHKAGCPANGSQVLGSCVLKDNKLLQARKPAGAPVQCQPNPRRRILVVEDEPDLRQLNVKVLQGSGYEVDAAEHGIVVTIWIGKPAGQKSGGFALREPGGKCSGWNTRVRGIKTWLRGETKNGTSQCARHLSSSGHARDAGLYQPDANSRTRAAHWLELCGHGHAPRWS